MSKQIDKQMNKRLVALKKGQIAILEALYGGVGLGDVGVLGWVRVPKYQVPYIIVFAHQVLYNKHKKHENFKSHHRENFEALSHRNRRAAATIA